MSSQAHTYSLASWCSVCGCSCRLKLPEQGDAMKPDHGYDNRCCHKTRLLGAPCPLGRVCPYDDEWHPAPSFTAGSKTAQQPVCTPPEPTPDIFLHAWKT